MFGISTLVGKYYVPNDNGTLIADFSKGTPELWLENQWLTFRLLPGEIGTEKQLCLSLGLKADQDVLEECYGRIFNRAVQAISAFNEGHRELFDFCLYFGIPAIELTENTPALAFVAAITQYFQRRLKSISPATEMLKKKRSLILRENGFPPSNWAVKLFQKIPASECSGPLFYDLREILGSANQRRLKTLRHLKRLNLLVVKVLADENFSSLFHPSFLTKISDLKQDDPLVDVFWQIHAVKDEVVTAIQDGFKIRQVQSFDDLRRVHENLIEWLGQSEYLINIESISFPNPPFKEILVSEEKGSCYGIFPITNGRGLWLEGQAMHHCIAGFATDIVRADGSLYAYHVEMSGEPAATVLISKEPSGWVIQEINGPCNEPASRKVLAFVHRWLERQNSSATSKRRNDVSLCSDDQSRHSTQNICKGQNNPKEAFHDH